MTNEPALPASRNTTEDIGVVGRTDDLEKKGPDHRTVVGALPIPHRAVDHVNVVNCYFTGRGCPVKVRYVW